MLKIGLTGGIGSGKSTVMGLFSELGVPCINADKIARELVQPNSLALNKIIEKFGSSIVTPDGQLKRSKLRSLIFDDDSARRWLNQLLHPLIGQRIKQWADTLDFDYCIIEIPLLIENKSFHLIDRVLVVDCEYQQQRQRAAQRDNTHQQAIQLIINKQATRQERLSQADDILVNEGSLDALKQAVHRLHDKYLSMRQA